MAAVIRKHGGEETLRSALTGSAFAKQEFVTLTDFFFYECLNKFLICERAGPEVLWRREEDMMD